MVVMEMGVQNVDVLRKTCIKTSCRMIKHDTDDDYSMINHGIVEQAVLNTIPHRVCG